MPNALAVIALSERGTMFDPGPCVYMEKMAGREEIADLLDLDRPLGKTRRADRRAQAGSTCGDVIVVVLDRPRHEEGIKAIREAGARVRLITDGDVSGALLAVSSARRSTCCGGSAARRRASSPPCALKCMGGGLIGRLWPRDDDERQAAVDAGYDLDRVLTQDELVSGDNAFFSATGVTDGDVLQGVRYQGARGATTESLVMRSRSGTVRRIYSRHDRTKLRALTGSLRIAAAPGARDEPAEREERRGERDDDAPRRRADVDVLGGSGWPSSAKRPTADSSSSSLASAEEAVGDDHVDARLRVDVEPLERPRERGVEVRDLDLDVQAAVARRSAAGSGGRRSPGSPSSFGDQQAVADAPADDAAVARHVVLGRVEAQQHERAPDQHHRALVLAVVDADEAERDPRQVPPVRAREALEGRGVQISSSSPLGHRRRRPPGSSAPHRRRSIVVCSLGIVDDRVATGLRCG